MEYRASYIRELMSKKPSTFELMQEQMVVVAKGWTSSSSLCNVFFRGRGCFSSGEI